MAPNGNTIVFDKSNENQFITSTKTKKKKRKRKKQKIYSPSLDPSRRKHKYFHYPTEKSGIVLTREQKKALKRTAQVITEPTPVKKPRLNADSVDIIIVESDTDRIPKEDTDDEVQLIENQIDPIIVSDGENSVIVLDSSINEIETKSVNEENLVINVSQTGNNGCFENTDSTYNMAVSVNRRSVDCSDLFENVRIENENFPHLRSHGFPKSWTKDMLKFYTEPCERTRNFDYAELQKMMPSDPSVWQINQSDRYISRKKVKRRYVCKKCNLPGHPEQSCFKYRVCSVCGRFDHFFYKCPYTLCLTCGEKSPRRNVTYCRKCENCWNADTICGLCGQPYHNDNYCSSKWRSFTTISDSSEPMKPNQRKYCYNCAQAGHLGFECPLEPESDYPLENPFRTALFDAPSLFGSNNGKNDRRVFFISNKMGQMLHSDRGDEFLKRYVNDRNVRVNLLRGVNDYVQIIGEKVAENDFKEQLVEFMSEQNKIDSD